MAQPSLGTRNSYCMNGVWTCHPLYTASVTHQTRLGYKRDSAYTVDSRLADIEDAVVGEVAVTPDWLRVVPEQQLQGG